jgi:hypothetical protein
VTEFYQKFKNIQPKNNCLVLKETSYMFPLKYPSSGLFLLDLMKYTTEFLEKGALVTRLNIFVLLVVL